MALRIIFMGSPEFAVPSLDALYHSPHNIVAVCSNPDKRRGRRGKASPTDVKKRAMELGFPTIDIGDIRSDAVASQLTDLKPDLFVVVAFRILPVSLLEIPRLGSINLHASLLPRYRGAAPIHWAVINGEKETGCSVFFLNDKVDTGEIIKQQKTPIGPMETTGELYNRLKYLGTDLLLESINDIAAGTVKPVPQDHELATPAPRLFKENTKVDFHESVWNIHNFIRGLNPFPLAWCTYNGEKMNLYASAPPGISAGEPETTPARTTQRFLLPGELCSENGKLLVGCGDGVLEIKKLQLPGTKRLSGQEFINGYDLSVKLE